MIPSNASPEVNRLLGVYCLDSTALGQLSQNMYEWSLSSLIGNKLNEYIISVMAIPYQPTTSERTAVTSVKYGKEITGNIFSGEAYEMKKRYVTIYSNTVSISGTLSGYMAYPPYSQWSIYLPFYGFAPLDPNAFYGGERDIGITYEADLVTGDCMISVFSVHPQLTTIKNLVLQVATNIGKKIELVNTDSTSYARNLFTSAVGAGVAYAVGGDATIGASVTNMAVSALTPATNVSTVGQTSAGTAIFGQYDVYLRIIKATTIDENAYIAEKGLPSAKHLQVSALAGYAEFAEINLDGITASEGEINEIDAILKSGFIA